MTCGNALLNLVDQAAPSPKGFRSRSLGVLPLRCVTGHGSWCSRPSRLWWMVCHPIVPSSRFTGWMLGPHTQVLMVSWSMRSLMGTTCRSSSAGARGGMDPPSCPVTGRSLRLCVRSSWHGRSGTWRAGWSGRRRVGHCGLCRPCGPDRCSPARIGLAHECGRTSRMRIRRWGAWRCRPC
jgi:hypothetical protein